MLSLWRFSLLKEAQITGIEIHQYAPFVTIKRHVQFGMNFAAGVGAIQGVGEKHYFYEDFSTHPVSQGEEITVIPAKEVFRESSGLPVMPLGKIELVVAVMPAPGLKVKFSGNQPETADGKLK